MQQPKDASKPWSKGVRHSHAPSLDTNASGIAESTISLGLARFPEPPASIPSTPTRYNFGKSNHTPSSPVSSVRRGPLPQPPPQNLPQQGSSLAQATFARNQHPTKHTQPSYNIHSSSPSSSSNVVPGYDWQDSASTIDVDATEDRLLPTSLITSLLQENREIRRAKRNSLTSDAMSGISEMTYPPILNRAEPYDPLQPSSSRSAARGVPHTKSQPPSAFPHGTKLSNRTSGDSETLHSLQGHPAIRTASLSRATRIQGASIVGVAPATLQTVSSASQISSTQDSDTIRSYEKGYQNRLTTTYESGDDDISQIKAYNNSDHNPSNLVQRRPQPEGHKPDVQGRSSIHSAKSAAPSFISKISGVSLRRVFNWRRAKPLPPVPIIPHIPIIEQHARQQEDEAAPLPDLVDRAGTLRDLLEKGHHPHDSLHSYQRFPDSSTHDVYEAPSRKMYGYPESRHTKLSFGSPASHITAPDEPLPATTLTPKHKNRRLCIAFSVFVIVVLAAIGVGVGVSLSRKKTVLPLCSGNFTGSTCQLDATCVCTASTPCNGLAQSVLDLVPVVNQIFTVNKTAASAYTDLWLMQGMTSTTNCVSQALVIDVGKNLDQTSFPNRTRWAQAALLWNAIQTQDAEASTNLQQFVKALPWSNIASFDGPTTSKDFAITIAGYTFDFAAQTVKQPTASFVTLGQPPNSQIQKVDSATQNTLDRMYGFAQASSIQRQVALKKYWSSVLLQEPENLATFKSVLAVAPIQLPFNASSRSIRSLYASTPSGPFPPPLSCFPNLNSTLRSNLNNFEEIIFGLSSTSNPAQFDPSCYPTRPIYGVLDVLQLRLPFLDSRNGLPRQAVTLMREAGPRAVIYNGELFSPSSASTPNIAASQQDPRQYGTLNLFDHVVLQYLMSMPNLSVATAVIQFVLGLANQGAVPPPLNSPLTEALPSLPSLEVAIFGTVDPADLVNSVSPLTNPLGSLFYGSNDGAALRNWTINTIGGPVVWTLNATSPLVVRDSSLGPGTLNDIWNAAAQAVARNDPTVGIGNVTLSLQQTNSFSP
ncbi:hypothetical protein CVT24_001056 [Panaeolus cyanescens]|uniref:Uncharacterized protein n=1 Tax=Panaeolus cyanescens TaxID=181874 RepID=A0A409VWZ3_9AGAR|nr:hypothetical protein CVT24_001056 [Panaeolus cyanescens]